MKGIKIYLDIDGVLITKRNHRPVNNALTFLQLITTHFDPYWLTTHCNGSNDQALYYLSKFFDKDFISVASIIKPTKWDNLKTNAIQILSDFYWIKDEPFNSEKLFLEKNHRLDRLIIPDYSKEADLTHLITFFSKLIHP